MITKILEYTNHYTVTVVDDGGKMLFEGTWGKDDFITPQMIKQEAELLAIGNIEEQPTEVSFEKDGE